MCFCTYSQSILTDAQKMSVHDDVDNDVKNQNGGFAIFQDGATSCDQVYLWIKTQV